MTFAEHQALTRKARVSKENPKEVIASWLVAGMTDFRNHRKIALAYGITLVALIWVLVWGFVHSGLGWMIPPMIAGGMLLGPMATVGLYRISRRALGRGGRGIAAPGQIFTLSVVMMVLVLAWIRAATLLFAVFYGLRPFAGTVETLATLFTTPAGLALLTTGTLVGGLFAALGFAISVFGFPMLVDRDIDAFTAMALSFNATTANLRLMILWGACVTGLTLAGLVTGLLALIPLFPILGFATWHAYSDLFQETSDV